MLIFNMKTFARVIIIVFVSSKRGDVIFKWETIGAFLFMFSMRNHTRSYTYKTFFSNLIRAMFILKRTNFVSTKNIDNCVLLFLYVLPIDNQAEVRRNADIQVPDGCHWPSLVGIFYELACT